MSYPTPVFGKHAKTLLLILLANVTCQAKIINVTTNDSYAKIEAAVAGDEVAIAGGTYAFRLYLTHQA
jgi:hypothetical protein